MSIVKITPPEATPQDVSDYQAQNNLTDARLSSEAFPIVSGNIVKGSKFIIQGSTFIADSDTPISGIESIYVKFVVSGSTATPSYISNITGVTWSDIYNGYYTGAGDFVFFDEMKAYILGDITTPKLIYNSIMSEITNQVLKKVSDVIFNSVNATTLISGLNLDITNLIQSSSIETGDINADTVNTGNGDVECYAMDQPTRTTDNVTFNDLSLNGEFNPAITGTETDGALQNDEEVYNFPVGLYSYIQITAAGQISATDYAILVIERKAFDGNWYATHSVDNTVGTFNIRTSDSLVSNGSNLRCRRVEVGSPGQSTVYSYRKS